LKNINDHKECRKKSNSNPKKAQFYSYFQPKIMEMEASASVDEKKCPKAFGTSVPFNPECLKAKAAKWMIGYEVDCLRP
jgi:hypothetical protein